MAGFVHLWRFSTILHYTCSAQQPSASTAFSFTTDFLLGRVSLTDDDCLDSCVGLKQPKYIKCVLDEAIRFYGGYNWRLNRQFKCECIVSLTQDKRAITYRYTFSGNPGCNRPLKKASSEVYGNPNASGAGMPCWGTPCQACPV